MMNNILVKAAIGAGGVVIGVVARPAVDKLNEKINTIRVNHNIKELKKFFAKHPDLDPDKVVDIAGYLTDHEDTEEAVLEFVN